jgi:diadenylate cyclase
LQKAWEAIVAQISSWHVIIDIIDILLVAIIIYFLTKFIISRRAGKLALGVLIFMVFLLLSEVLEMKALHFILAALASVGIVALIIIFQPEIRTILEKFGAVSFIKNFTETKNSKTKNAIISSLCEGVEQLANSYTGALIVIERSVQLADEVKSGTIINADVSPTLMRSIFFNKSPMHDGAIIVRGGRIYAAGCFLPISTQENIVKELGSRHRSAIGMSENSDAVVVVVSEETGTISVAIDGQLKRNYDRMNLEEELNKLLPDSLFNGKLK